MAGSLYHIVDDDGQFTMAYIDDLGDAHEALEECFAIIYELTDGSQDAVNAVCERLGFPRIDHDMVQIPSRFPTAPQAGE